MTFDAHKSLLKLANAELIADTLVCDGTVRQFFVHVPPRLLAESGPKSGTEHPAESGPKSRAESGRKSVAKCGTNFPAERKEEALPVVLAFHGGGGKANLLGHLTGLNILARKEDFIVVYPQGLNKHWNDGRGVHDNEDTDDIGFIESLLEKLAGDYHIDQNRLYAAGISNGGFFAQYLAIKRPNRFAAIASVAATLGKPVYENLTPPQPVPIIFILGKADPFVPFDGGEIKIGSRRLGIVVSARQAIDFWVQANHCADQTEPDRIIIDGETITKTRYWGQTDRSDIAEISIEEAGHSWPGGWQYLPKRLIGDTSQAVNATAEIWEFFKAHALKD